MDTWWPLAVGEAWDQTCAFNRTKNGQRESVLATTSYRVEARENVVVPAGSFDAFRVRVTGDNGQVTLQHLAKAACGVVRSASLASDGTERLVSELQSYHCSGGA
jgi:hypothetical protein